MKRIQSVVNAYQMSKTLAKVAGAISLVLLFVIGILARAGATLSPVVKVILGGAFSFCYSQLILFPYNVPDEKKLIESMQCLEPEREGLYLACVVNTTIGIPTMAAIRWNKDNGWGVAGNIVILAWSNWAKDEANDEKD